MNAKQRRLKRRVIAPAVEVLASALDGAASTGQPLYPDEMRQLAKGLRNMVRGDRNWLRAVQPTQDGKPAP